MFNAGSVPPEDFQTIIAILACGAPESPFLLGAVCPDRGVAGSLRVRLSGYWYETADLSGIKQGGHPTDATSKIIWRFARPAANRAGINLNKWVTIALERAVAD